MIWRTLLATNTSLGFWDVVLVCSHDNLGFAPVGTHGSGGADSHHQLDYYLLISK